jgi:tetratricopeptide (TPR) repeat protein/predicted Ser/Thr protein kinase
VPTAPTVPAVTPPATTAEGALGRGALFGRYVIVDVIGEGGMGQVFAAYDASLDRNIALKIVRHAPERVAQVWLVREAKAMARVQHPAIVAVHDIGAVGSRVYIAMELVRGTTLHEWVQREQRTWRRVVEMYVAAGRGLEAAHAAGVVHRDFKPENVLVDGNDRARVTDFGLAELRDEGGKVPASAGTPRYMAPEQYIGRGADARSDQFSFCVALWQDVYGEHPFAERDADLRSAVTAGKLRPASDRAPRWLADVLRRGLAVDPDARFPTMTALLAALERHLARRRLRVVVPVALVLAGAATATTIALAARDTGPSCATTGARAASVWDAHRAKVEKALGAPRVVAALDGYTRAWSAQRVEACRATHERGEQSGELLDLRMECLDRRLDEVAALVGVLETGEPGVRASAANAVGSLVPLSACEDVKALRDVLPAAPAVRARVVALREAATHVGADMETGRFAHGLAAVGPLVKEADTLGYDPLIGELETMHGVLEWRTDHMDAAETALYRAVARAEAGRDAAASARAWLELVRFTSQERKRLDEALRLGVLAQGAVDRYAGDPAYVSMLAEQLGWIALDQNKLDEAERQLQRAYDLRRAQLPEDDPAVAASIEHLAMVAAARGQHDKALDLHRRALAGFEHAYGPDHPDTLTEMMDYGAELFEAGKYDEADAMYRDGLARVERTLGDEGIDAAMYQHDIALVDTARGKHDEAIALERRALAIFEHVRGPKAPDTINQRLELAHTLYKCGHKKEAIEAYRASVPLAEEVFGHDSQDAKDARKALVEVQQ